MPPPSAKRPTRPRQFWPQCSRSWSKRRFRPTPPRRTWPKAEARKKSAEEGLANLKKRIAAAKQTHLADEQAAKAAEAAAAPLKVEADKTRAAYAAAMKIADDKRALAEQAKADLYRLVAARQVANLMESSDPPKPANRIDEIVFAKLKALGIKPVLCSDAVFVRRAYLDLTGKLPSAEEAKAFIQSPDKNKRVALIDRLLDQSAHVDYWAMKWSDILRVKAEFPVKVWPNAAQAYHRWVWESIAQNKPYDQFARELLTSSGSNFRVGPVNFYRAIQDKTPEGIAAAVGLALMGTRVHFWPEGRRAGMAVFFSQVGYKPTSEWKEEIVFWDPLKSVAVPGSTAPGMDAVAKSVTVTNQIPQALAKPLSENGPLAAVFPDGAKTTIPPDRDPREVFADWLIRPENPWFAKSHRQPHLGVGDGTRHYPRAGRYSGGQPAQQPRTPGLLAEGAGFQRLRSEASEAADLHLDHVPVLFDTEVQRAGSESQLRQLPVAASGGRGVDRCSERHYRQFGPLHQRCSGAFHVYSQRHVRGGAGRRQHHQFLPDVVRTFLAVHGDGRRARQRACLDPVAAHAEFGHNPEQASERPEARGDALLGRQNRGRSPRDST